MGAKEEPPGPVARRLVELLPAGSGSVGGALVGLALGGPEGALAGAAVEPVLAQVVSETLTRRRQRAGRALAVAATEVGTTPEALLQQILANERLLDLAAAVVAAASETMLEAKIRALGRALASGVLAHDEAVVDKQRFLVDTLTELDAPHVRVLTQLSVEHEDYWPTIYAPGQEGAHGWSAGDLAAELPGVAPVLQPVLHGLASRALVTDTGQGTWGYRGVESQRWVLTDFGKSCLAELELLGQAGSDQPRPVPPGS
jgi:hypothetical protein